jgi:acetyl-CoA C-acetyltransferase
VTAAGSGRAGGLPVITGVGQTTNRNGRVLEPLELIAEAAAAALADAGIGTGAELASISVVNVVGWCYEDLGALLAERLGVTVRTTSTSPHGGDQPTRLLAAAGRRAAEAGGVHLIVGGEAIRSLMRAFETGDVAGWTPQPPGAAPPDPKDVVTPEAYRHHLRMPSTVYPLYEHGLRAALGQTRSEAQAWSASLWEAMSRVAATNPGSWFPDPVDADRIERVDEGNRMICDPYPKLMNAILTVDQAAAVVVTDTDTARASGVGDDRVVHLWAEAGAVDTRDFLARTAYHRSPAMERVLSDVLAAGLGDAGADRDALSSVELYSCFPCVPKLALTHLGWPRDTATSVTGGLTFFGGPGNAYMLCAAAAMAEAVRGADNTRPALLFGQGEFVTKHHALVVGREPRPGGALPPDEEGTRQRHVDAESSPKLDTSPEGTGVIETFTVEFGRDGSPERAIVVGRLEDGRRFVANDPDADDMAELVAPGVETVGRKGTVAPGDPNRFTLM